MLATLASSPRKAVLFALLTLKDVQLAWNTALSLGLDRDDVWERLAAAYEKVDSLAVLPVLARLVHNDLTEAGAQHYRIAARRLARMRKLATGSAEAAGVDGRIAKLRDRHRRRPRLQQEFDRVGLPPENTMNCSQSVDDPHWRSAGRSRTACPARQSSVRPARGGNRSSIGGQPFLH